MLLDQGKVDLLNLVILKVAHEPKKCGHPGIGSIIQVDDLDEDIVVVSL